MQGCRVGFGRVDLTPDKPEPSAGWGPLGPRNRLLPLEPEQRMFATALALEDSLGEQLVLVNADLHSGGRHLWQAAVDASGLDPSRVILSGTHTHAAPAHRYGGPLYTLLASPSMIRPFVSSSRMAPLVAEAVRQALRSLTPGGVTVTRAVVADVASNRALPAWTHYDEATQRRFLHRGPGSLVDRSAPLTDRCRDPRVTVLVARSDNGSTLVAQAWYPIHGNSLGLTFEHLGADLWGCARNEAERDGWIVGLAAGPCGDISPLPTTETAEVREHDERRPTAQGPELADIVGRRIGEAIHEAAAAATVEPFTLAAAHERWRPRLWGLPHPMHGLAQAGAGLDGPTDRLADVGDGVRSPRYRARRKSAYSMAGGQGPKIALVQAYVPVPLRFGFLWRLLAPRWLPLHVVRIGDHAMATVPGEATTMSGWRIEEAVRQVTGCATASVIGFAGDYAGYWVTPEEYLEQRYEAAATIWGREAATVLTDRLAALAADVIATR